GTGAAAAPGALPDGADALLRGGSAHQGDRRHRRAARRHGQDAPSSGPQGASQAAGAGGANRRRGRRPNRPAGRKAMTRKDEPRRTWWCGVAERLGVAADGAADAGAARRWAPLHRLARRPAPTGAHRPGGPDGLLDAVMVRIAAERERGLSPAAAVPTADGPWRAARAGRGAASVWARVARGAAAGAALAAAALGLAGSATVGRPVVDAVPLAMPALAEAVRSVVLDAFYAVNAAALEAGPAGQMLLGLIWGLAGLVAALAVSAAGESARDG